MKAVFAHDTFYRRMPDGVFAEGAFPYTLWAERFLPHFKEITVIGRERANNTAGKVTGERSDGPGVNFLLLPNINKPLARLVNAQPVLDQIHAAVAGADALIVRGPVEFAMAAASSARALGKPYAVEMSGCAFDHTFYHGSLLGKFYAPVKYHRARQMVAHADGVIYVTQSFLQKRYPTKAPLQATASNVEVVMPPDHHLKDRIARISALNQRPFSIGIIGNYGNKLKGIDIALKAMNEISQISSSYHLNILGQGDAAPWYHMIDRLGIADKVTFCGALPGAAVAGWLDTLDLYIQPSFHEGLPRALIEAMSRGLPALASNAGGTDELLDPRCIHPRGHAHILARHIKRMMDNPQERAHHAQRNFEAARAYSRAQLLPIRMKFWAAFAALAAQRKEQLRQAA
ncbi:MAG: glycosyltransferase family 4 protein [Alphaproteobacteria bacterium]|nr:glycosyltransferase family 4 protein [Alphaproteobacteria bacterium]